MFDGRGGGVVTDELSERLNARPTAELLAILREQNTEEWRPEVFLLVEAILQARGIDAAAVKAAGPRPKETPEFAPPSAITMHPYRRQREL